MLANAGKSPTSHGCEDTVAAAGNSLLFDEFIYSSLKSLPTFINASLPSGFYKPLGLRFLFLLSICFARNLASFWLLSHRGPSSISRSIGQPLTDDALKRTVGPLNIVHTKTNAVVIAEIELRKVAVKASFFAVLVIALHAALEDPKRRLRWCWCVRHREHIPGVALDGFVTLEKHLRSEIEAAFVGMQPRL